MSFCEKSREFSLTIARWLTCRSRRHTSSRNLHHPTGRVREKQRRRGGVTSLPVSFRIVSVGNLGDEISKFYFRISDTLPGTSAENQQIVKAAFPEAVRVVSACLGAEPSGTPWVSPGARWELEGGRQLNLLRGEDTIILQYWSKQMADIERHEQSHGVDPSNNLADRE